MILVCGEALFDVFTGTETDRGALALEAHAGGSPFNVAIGLARLGAPSALLTGLSQDRLGERLAARLAREGVETGFLVRSGRRTTLSLVDVGDDGVPHYQFYGLGSADCSLTEADMPALPETVKALHFGSYSIAVDPVAGAFAALATREQHRFISLDPNVRLNVEPSLAAWRARIGHYLPLATLVKVSDEDLDLLFPGADPLTVLRDWAAQGPALTVMTRGGEGVTAIRADGVTLTLPAHATTLVDTVGAGDTFQAALLDGLRRHDALERAALLRLSASALEAILARAARAAAITCSRRGADLPRLRDLR